MTGRWPGGQEPRGRWAPIINVGMSSPDSGGCRLPPITPIDDAVADPTADHHDTHRSSTCHQAAQHHDSYEALSATPRLLPFPAWFEFGAVLSPDAQSRRSSHRGNKWRFRGLGESNVRIAPIHARRRSGLPLTLALPIATILTSVADGHLSQLLDWRQDERDRWPRPLRPCQRSGRSDRDRRPGPGFRTGGALPDVSGLITRRIASCWPMRFIRHPYVGSGNLGALSILAPAPLARSTAGELIMSRLRL